MKKIFIVSLLLSLSLVLSACHKNTTPEPQPDYCSTLTGTWEGTYYDTTSLFGHGGPWPIKISLHYLDGQVVGHVLKGRYGIGHMIWGHCSNNHLTNLYFLHSLKSCGTSSSGSLTNKHQLNLTINYQNAMIDTTFKAKLKRVNYQFDHSFSIKGVVLPKDVKTCH